MDGEAHGFPRNMIYKWWENTTSNSSKCKCLQEGKFLRLAFGDLNVQQLWAQEHLSYLCKRAIERAHFHILLCCISKLGKEFDDWHHVSIVKVFRLCDLYFSEFR